MGGPEKDGTLFNNKLLEYSPRIFERNGAGYLLSRLDIVLPGSKSPRQMQANVFDVIYSRA